MKAMDSLPREWSIRKWLTVTLSLFGLQLVLIYFLGSRAPEEPASGEEGTTFVSTLSLDGVYLSSYRNDLEDPSLFALGHPRGFSGEVWLNPSPLEHERYEWEPDPAWLEPSVERLGSEFTRFIRSYRPKRLSVAEKRPPDLSDGWQTDGYVRSESSLAIRGELEQWELEALPELPAIVDSRVLSHSVVRLLVGSNGDPISAMLLDSSGSESADEKAVAIAKRLRFEPLEGGGDDDQVVSGWIRFQWHTEPSRSSPTESEP